ncbi:MAG: CDP-diacylglycerol--glycerol-3-phosphate 3-phosphatidyltransferase [Candidatus Omnitrophica bacterium]|nr:CDP-diacylglycerol--glycerol-3-phosphate 3-phosphatidyltransferase [Candidatus Omnitrophota bacterium]
MNLPNYITLFRILLVPFVFSFIVYYNSAHEHFRPIALILFIIAIATDALDGFIARTFRKRTELGTFLDPFADKLLLLSAFFGITFSNTFILKPPLWIVIIIVFRDLFIICGLAIIFLTTNQIRIQPNLVGKLTTFFQMLTIFAVLANWDRSHAIWYIAAFLTILSCALYLIKGIKLLNSPSAT